ncbi:MAG: hypothetical protein IJV27_01490, partial [Prevotella sp.]|nr:hypothetical protein [Prevotella sp.]
MTLLFALFAGGVKADEITDELTLTSLGLSSIGTNYTAFTGKSVTSDAVYAGSIAGGNSSIQLRSYNTTDGIVSSTSGGTIKSVKITFN